MCDNDDTSISINQGDPLYDIIIQLKQYQFENENKIKYYRFKKITELINTITNNNGIIFGGCPRDLILREINSKKFWEHCKENNINFINNYYNPIIHPETFNDRIKLPNDIDIKCVSSSVSNLLTLLQDKDFTLKKLKISELYRTSYGIKHNKYKLEYKPNNSKLNTTLEKLYNYELYFTINIDIIYGSTQKDLDNYFDTKLDVMCNQLQITSVDRTEFIYECLPNIINFKKKQNGSNYKSSIYSSLLPYELLKNIMKQIEEKKAVVLCPDAYRIDKMTKLGYTLVFVECISYLNYYIKKDVPYNTLQITPVNNLDECFICLCSDYGTTNTEQFLNTKVLCCTNNHSVHLKCFVKNIVSQYEQDINLSCPICRNQEICISPQLLSDLNKFIIKLEQLLEI